MSSKFVEWMKVRESLDAQPTEAEVQARSLKQLLMSTEDMVQQIMGVNDVRRLIQGESRQEFVRLANWVISPDGIADSVKTILVSQFKTGRRDASNVYRAAEQAKAASREFLTVNNDAERNDDISRLQGAVSKWRAAMANFGQALKNYLS